MADPQEQAKRETITFARKAPGTPKPPQDGVGGSDVWGWRAPTAPGTLSAHLLTAAGGNVWGTRFLTQWFDDSHLSKVFHRLLELRQGPPAIALAAFDVLGLRFWGGICDIQEQNVISNMIFAPRSHHTALAWLQHFELQIATAIAPGHATVAAPFQDHDPHSTI